VTPIFVRPVREQLEHDRLIRFLVAKFKAKRKFDVLANVGDERQAPIKVGNNTYFPDLILVDGKKVAALIEIETSESTNNLEAMAQWTHFSHARVPFHLYVPVLAVDTARRLCEANNVMATEIWSYRPVNDQFDLVRVHLDNDAVRASSKGSKAASMPVVLPPPKPVVPPPPPPAPVVTPAKVSAAQAKAAIGKAAPVVPAPVAGKSKAPVAVTKAASKPTATPPAPKPKAKPSAKVAAKPPVSPPVSPKSKTKAEKSKTKAEKPKAKAGKTAKPKPKGKAKK
jgi:hypothetical protein